MLAPEQEGVNGGMGAGGAWRRSVCLWAGQWRGASMRSAQQRQACGTGGRHAARQCGVVRKGGACVRVWQVRGGGGGSSGGMVGGGSVPSPPSGRPPAWGRRQVWGGGVVRPACGR